jgi:hypothetical protein
MRVHYAIQRAAAQNRERRNGVRSAGRGVRVPQDDFAVQAPPSLATEVAPKGRGGAAKSTAVATQVAGEAADAGLANALSIAKSVAAAIRCGNMISPYAYRAAALPFRTKMC